MNSYQNNFLASQVKCRWKKHIFINCRGHSAVVLKESKIYRQIILCCTALISFDLCYILILFIYFVLPHNPHFETNNNFTYFKVVAVIEVKKNTISFLLKVLGFRDD